MVKNWIENLYMRNLYDKHGTISKNILFKNKTKIKESMINYFFLIV